MVTRLGKVLIYNEQIPLIKLLNPSVNWLCTRPITNKHGKVVTDHEKLPPINSRKPLNIC